VYIGLIRGVILDVLDVVGVVGVGVDVDVMEWCKNNTMRKRSRERIIA
jgi:hypothetical protein